jgi:hypothetical protein
MVKNLNAQYLGGKTETGLAVTGGEGFTEPGTDTPISGTPPVVASTGKLAGGTYYVTATAELSIGTGNSFGLCWIAWAQRQTQSSMQVSARREVAR